MGYKSYALMAILLASLVPVMLVGTAHAQTATLTVSTDKAAYQTGDKVTISGNVGAIKAGQPVLLQVTDPKGVLVRVDQIAVMADGSYTYTFPTGGLMKNSGEHIVVVTYGSFSQRATFQFTATGVPAGNTAPLTIDGTTYQIEYSINGGTLNSLTADKDLATITAAITSTADGNLTLKLPRSVIQSLTVEGSTGGKDAEFAVFNDGVQGVYDETATTDTYRTINIMFEKGTTEIDVVGTWMVPEFGAIAAIILAVAIVGIVAAARYNKFSFMPKLG